MKDIFKSLNISALDIQEFVEALGSTEEEQFYFMWAKILTTLFDKPYAYCGDLHRDSLKQRVLLPGEEFFLIRYDLNGIKPYVNGMHANVVSGSKFYDLGAYFNKEDTDKDVEKLTKIPNPIVAIIECPLEENFKYVVALGARNLEVRIKNGYLIEYVILPRERVRQLIYDLFPQAWYTFLCEREEYERIGNATARQTYLMNSKVWQYEKEINNRT